MQSSGGITARSGQPTICLRLGARARRSPGRLTHGLAGAGRLLAGLRPRGFLLLPVGSQRALAMPPECGHVWSTATDPQMPRRAPWPPPGPKSQLSCDFTSGASVGLEAVISPRAPASASRRLSAAPDRRSARPRNAPGVQSCVEHSCGPSDASPSAAAASRPQITTKL